MKKAAQQCGKEKTVAYATAESGKLWCAREE